MLVIVSFVSSSSNAVCRYNFQGGILLCGYKSIGYCKRSLGGNTDGNSSGNNIGYCFNVSSFNCCIYSSLSVDGGSVAFNTAIKH